MPRAAQLMFLIRAFEVTKVIMVLDYAMADIGLRNLGELQEFEIVVCNFSLDVNYYIAEPKIIFVHRA